LQFGFSVCFVLLDDVTTSSGLKETSKLWRLLVERGAGNRCTDVFFDFSQLTVRRNIFPQQNFLSMTDEKFSKNFCFNLRHLNVMSVWPFLQFGFSVCFVLLDVTTSSGLKETSTLWRLLVERDAEIRCTTVHCL
jgi:hypothetical protein